MRHAVVWKPLTESLIHGLLLVAKRPYSQALAAPTEPGRPAAVRDAMDIIEATPHLPLTTSTLARQCYVSVRTLQQDSSVTWACLRWPICAPSGCVMPTGICGQRILPHHRGVDRAQLEISPTSAGRHRTQHDLRQTPLQALRAVR
jgi:hypothetical protein